MQSGSSESFTMAVDVEWTRQGHAPGFIRELVGTQSIKRAMWKQKKGKYILVLPAFEMNETVNSNNFSELVGVVETKLYLADEGVTLDRTGVIRWAHEFVPLKLQASLMHLGGLVLPVVVETQVLSAEWGVDAGNVHLQFVLTVGEDQYPVTWSIRFQKSTP